MEPDKKLYNVFDAAHFAILEPSEPLRQHPKVQIQKNAKHFDLLHLISNRLHEDLSVLQYEQQYAKNISI